MSGGNSGSLDISTAAGGPARSSFGPADRLLPSRGGRARRGHRMRLYRLPDVARTRGLRTGIAGLSP